MSETVDIGVARVRLIVDAQDFETIIAQGKNAVTGFGDVAQQAYDRTERGTRRAADALLDYVNSLGRADSTLDRYLRNASRMGVEKPVLDAATLAWGKYTDSVEQASLARQRLQQNAQFDINELVAPSINTDSLTKSLRRQDAEAAFASIVEQENEALRQQQQLVEMIATARQHATQTTAQQDWNRILGIPQEEEKLALAQRRRDAEAAFLPIIEQEIKLENENSQLVAKQQAFLQQLQQLEAVSGKSAQEIMQLRAAELGLSDVAGPLIAKIHSANAGMEAGTVSAKQYAQGVRELGPQFTDIIGSLQGGQSIFIVMTREAGRLKDMFGSVENGLVAVRTELTKLALNPWLLLAAAIAGVAFAAYEASGRMTEMAIAVAKGNEVAGNAKELSELAVNLSKLGDISVGNAEKAIQALAEGGRLTGENFKEAAQAAARWATITGESADNVAKKFDEVAAGPMQAVLNGTLKVTDAQFQQLQALERSGNRVAEVALAIKLYQDQVNTNSQAVLSNISEGARGWIELKKAISDATHSLTEFLAKAAGATFNAWRGKGVHATGLDEQGNLMWAADEESSGAAAAKKGVETATASTERAKTLTIEQSQANEKLEHTFDSLATRGLAKYNVLLRELNANLKQVSAGELANRNITVGADGAFSGAGYQTLLADIRQKAYGEREGGDPTRPIKEWEKTTLDALKNVQQAQEYLYADHAIGPTAYYENLKGLARADAVIQTEAINKQIDALKGRVNEESRIKQLIQERQTVEQTLANTTEKLDHQKLEALKAESIALRDYSQQLADANIALARQGDQASAAVGLGSREAALAAALSNAQFNSDLRNRGLTQQQEDGKITADQADKLRAENAAALSTQLTILKGNYESLTTAESDWANGARKAWQDWSDQVNNVAQQTNTLVSGMLNDMTTALTDFVRSGHLSFSKFISDILAQIEKSGIQYALKQALSGASSYGSDSNSVIGSGFGGYLTAIGSLLFSAKGNAFGAGTGLAAYSNSVVTQPTYFPFAKGGVPNVGLMGEQPGSPGEAIMPLTRTSGGELAVKATGAGQAKVINTYQTFVVPGATNRQTQDQIAVKTYGAAQRAARRS